jgi:hypothetical protein
MLSNIFKKDITIIRRSPGAYRNMRWEEGIETTFTIKANVQPTPAEVMEIFPEGYRTEESYTLYTNIELFPSNTAIGNLNNSDIVVLHGIRFIVKKKETWSNTILSHYVSIIIKEGFDEH